MKHAPVAIVASLSLGACFSGAATVQYPILADGLGVAGNLISGGTIPLLNLVVGVEVASGFAILASEFLDQTAVIRTRRK